VVALIQRMTGHQAGTVRLFVTISLTDTEVAEGEEGTMKLVSEKQGLQTAGIERTSSGTPNTRNRISLLQKHDTL
jgi:hypothetical protein